MQQPPSTGSHSAGPHSAGSHSVGSHSAGPHSAGPHSARPRAPVSEPGTLIGRRLRSVVDELQAARAGSPALDELIDGALAAIRLAFGPDLNAGFAAAPSAGWSDNLAAALTALPENYNFSVGQRDGICWAWLQPNDDWQPGEFEARHDHPGGSGLVVAYTAALALICAALLLYAGLLETSARLVTTAARQAPSPY